MIRTDSEPTLATGWPTTRKRIWPSWSSRTGPPLEWRGSSVIERIPGPEHWTRLSGAIQSVYVLADHRNGGLGSILIRELIEGARQKGLDYLSVHPSPRSFPFYRRLSFRGEGSLLFLDTGIPIAVEDHRSHRTARRSSRRCVERLSPRTEVELAGNAARSVRAAPRSRPGDPAAASQRAPAREASNLRRTAVHSRPVERDCWVS